MAQAARPAAGTAAAVAKAPATSPVPAKAASPTAALPARPAAAPAPAAATVAAPATAPAAGTLDLKSLEQRLRDTKAIGVFTKLALKNQVDDLLTGFRGHHSGKPRPPLPELRQNFDGLMLKVLTLLQDDDPALAKTILSSRDALWGILADPVKFAQI